tara:strand:- start:1155 stop:1619 length:465 start_codon:yes stop_codon:yes gene_type:complete
MIKTDVIVTNKIWFKYFKNPEFYIKKKVSKLNKANLNFIKSNIFLLSLNLSDSKQIKKLNSFFRKKNKSTDILSFPFYVNKKFEKIKKLNKKVYMGDIIINIYKLNKKNKEIFEKDFNKLLIHGLLHLFGYNHKKEKDYLAMNKLENQLYKIIN